MKRAAITSLLGILIACSPAPKATQQELFMISADRFEAAAGSVSFDVAIKTLGAPETTQVNIKACPSISFSAINRVKSELETAGYTRLGFAPFMASDTPRCTPT